MKELSKNGNNELAVNDMAKRIAEQAPTLANLDAEQLEQIARIVITQRLTSELNKATELAGIDYEAEKEKFLDDTKSPHTRRAYAAAFTRYDAFTAKLKIEPLAIGAVEADNFIRELKTEGRAPASIRKDISVMSAFFSFLERYHSTIKNPFRGTKLRPKNRPAKETIIPTAKDIRTLRRELPPYERAMLEILAGRGLRVGALPTLTKKGDKWTGYSKGKSLGLISLPEPAIRAIEAAGLDKRQPFALNINGNPMKSSALERRINYRTTKLKEAGKIEAAYSCHDFRHFFAVTEYQKDKDIYRVSKLLGHGGIQITQIYLKGLGLDV